MSSVIGATPSRTDGAPKVTGEAVYGVDYAEPGMLHGRLLRSPLPSAAITSIDTSEARAMPGVHAVLNAADAPDLLAGWVLREQRLFARDVVRYEGEPIALVVADGPDEAAEALAAIRLELEVRQAVGDIETALADDAPLVHPEWESYEPAGPADHPRYGNVAAEMISDPDPEAFAAAFERADAVVEEEFRAPRQYQAYLEPKSAFARYEGGRYVVHTAHQYPFNVRDRVAQFLGVRPSDVRVL
jgi:CO/xanthine dehydrogenase Mo-binding subunit